MHHQHVVAGLRSCSISVAPGEREAGEGKGGQEQQTEGHLCGQLCVCKEEGGGRGEEGGKQKLTVTG